MISAPGRLVVLAPNWLGDAVMALPLIADVHRAWPDTHISVAARPGVAPLFAMVPEVADVLRFEGHGRTALATWRLNAQRLQEGRFDAALLLPNSFLSAWLALRARIPERWGYARDLRARLLTRAIPRPEPHVHQAEYYQALATGLGIPTGERFARVTVTASDSARARDLLREAGHADQRPFIVFAPGAAYGRAKQWLPERFAELAQLLAQRGIATVLVGTSAEAGVCAEIMKLTGLKPGPSGGLKTQPPVPEGPGLSPVNLSGKTNLATLAAVMSLGEATVTNDSGAMHLAGAVGAPVVAIFGPTDDRKTFPLRAHASAPAPVIVATNVWCRPCLLRECPIDHRCMTGVSARAVFDRLALEARASGVSGASGASGA